MSQHLTTAVHIIIFFSSSATPKLWRLLPPLLLPQSQIYLPSSSTAITTLSCLVSYVTGETQCPFSFLLDDNGKLIDKVNPLYNQWIQTDQMILSWITSSLTPKVLATIINKIDLASTWSSLQERYVSTSQNRIIKMRIELMNTSHGDPSIADYLYKINVITDNLALYDALVS